jgi:GNAT superfamily N-acetyltransferase
VWPTFRRLGIGSWLEANCAAEARSRGCPEIHLLMNEADSVLRLRGAGRAFAAACGYALRWKNTVAPRAVATGAKRLDNNPASREHLRHALRRTGPA